MVTKLRLRQSLTGSEACLGSLTWVKTVTFNSKIIPDAFPLDLEGIPGHWV